MLIIITEKLQQCNFEYWLKSQKHKRGRRSCRSNYTVFTAGYLLSNARIAGRSEEKKNKARWEEAGRNDSSIYALYGFNQASMRTCNQSGSTNELEQVLFGIHWLMPNLGCGIPDPKPPHSHVVFNSGLFNNAFLAGSYCSA